MKVDKNGRDFGKFGEAKDLCQVDLFEEQVRSGSLAIEKKSEPRLLMRKVNWCQVEQQKSGTRRRRGRRQKDVEGE